MNANTEIGLAVVAAVVSCDLPTLRTVVHQDVRWHLPKSSWRVNRPELVSGLAQEEANLKDTRARRYRDLRHEVIHVVSDEHSCCVLFDMFVTTFTNAEYQNQYVFFIRIENGLAVDVWELSDTALVYDNS